MSEPGVDEFIELERSFHDLRVDPDAGDGGELRTLLSGDKAIGWDQLLVEYRLVLLAEAGAGKTAEIRAAARRLRREGQFGFFLRIEHIADHFEESFEVGDADEFQTWLASSKGGWLLLDSVDEARLGSPRDFELAMRKLSRQITTALQRAHIIITGRTTAWRPKTDLQLCRELFPFTPLGESAVGRGSGTVRETDNGAIKPFRIVSLGDLRQGQIKRFLAARGVENVPAFLEAVERADAWTFTARPQDLEELANFWSDEGRIGSRLEIMRASLDRRLSERDPNRADTRPLSLEKAREGARLVAAATSLAKQPLVSVPGRTEDSRALSLHSILVGWNEAECAALISRPIFDEAIYGTVRFHHRTVREYLTAEWLHSLLVRQGSRRRIEELFFREQYGMPVVVPTMRPILPWLAILDQGILNQVLRLAPEITFEGGDPTWLPAETRRVVLRQVCERLALPEHGRSVLDYAAVQRFAGADIAQDIRSLLAEYAENDTIVWFLLRLVWHGKLIEVASEVKHIAITAREKYSRSAALKAICIVGTAEDAAEIRASILAESTALLRDWLAEITLNLPQDRLSSEWLGSALEKVDAKEQFSVDRLSDALGGYIDSLPFEPLANLARSMGELLARPPLTEQSSQFSRKFEWLAPSIVRALRRLVKTHHPSVLEHIMLTTLRKLYIAHRFMEEVSSDISQFVRAWPELNHALFWHCVAEARTARKKTDDPLVNFYQITSFRADQEFSIVDVDRIVESIAAQPLLDDQCIALSVAFALYIQSEQSRALLERIKKVVAGQPILEGNLQQLLHPPAGGHVAWREQERKWKQERERREARKAREFEEGKNRLKGDLDAVRGANESSVPTPAQYYLQHQMKNSAEAKGRWTDGDWESLIPKFGEEVARAFRDGAVAFWRRSRPLLVSEGAEKNSTPFSTVFGLVGLAIDAKETPNWAAGLSAMEAKIAVFHAFQELNGFPPWLSEIYTQYPDVVIEAILNEITYELDNDTGERESTYLLYKISWDGRWMWDRLGPALLSELAGKPRNPGNLRYILQVIEGASVPDEALATAASSACVRSLAPALTVAWFATWVGVDPASALASFETYLAGLPTNAERTNSTMMFATQLLGSRRDAATSRQAFRTVEHLKRIFILLHTHVRRGEDINRVGTGAYSPVLRDDAQDARDSILTILIDTPGKEAFLALVELSQLHPDDAARPWMAFQAKAKAERDAEAAPWTTKQLVEFHEQLERTPSNHRQLWELALSRLLDLKDDIERGDTSIASILRRVDAEEELRNFVGGWCRDRASGRYSVPQEEELADAKRPDLRFLGMGFDAPVPIELKIADKWTGPHLFERLETQLCGDYLRDTRSSRGLFVLIYRGTRARWDLPDGTSAEDFPTIIAALQGRWATISYRFPHIEDVRVVGIDLMARQRRRSSGRSGELRHAPKITPISTSAPRKRPNKRRDCPS